MSTYNGFKVAALAASIALAMGSTAAMAADPAANQLPGQGHAATTVVAAGTATITTPGGVNTLTIPLLTDGVITWKNGTAVGDINPTGTAGFNVGSGAAVDFTGAKNVLNVDSSGNASQIFGAITNVGGSTFVANTNGIIVGATGSITATGDVGLIANTLDAAPSFTGTVAGFVYNGTGGDVTVQPGATIGAGGDVFIAGGGNVNVDLGNVTGTIALTAGLPSIGAFTAKNAAATVTATGGSTTTTTIDSLSSAGTATTNGMVEITDATDTTVAGVLTNNGNLTLTGDAGNVHNQGQLTATTDTFTSLVNDGSYAAGGAINVNGGNLTNNGDITGAGTVVVNDGNITNIGSIAGVDSLTTQSDSADAGYAAGSQYFVNNTGTIKSTANLQIGANAAHLGGTANDSTGSFTNTGTLQLGAAGNLIINANNNVSLGGTLKAGTTALSATNTLGAVSLTADQSGNGVGALTVSAPLFFGANTAVLSGAQVKLMANVIGGTVAAPAGSLVITAGDAATGDYSVRVANGTTASADFVSVDSAADTSASTILQGTLAGNVIQFGSATPVSDVFSGPNGGINALGAGPYVEFNFTGALKTAKYNNANNFRYNYLSISAPDDTLTLVLNPTAYLTNGTSNGKSAVNLLVNGDVDLVGGAPYTVPPTSAVTGVTNTPNTHLVLQSTGDIATLGDFYWPGYVYLGNVDSTTAGAALPGTLSADGKITLGGVFSNVLPGDVAGASGIHFMTGNAVTGTTVATNANAFVNFATDLLTQNYAQGILTSPTFTGGVATGLIVNYGALDASMFNTHPVDATK